MDWAEHFGVVTWAPEIIELIEQGKLTETVTLTPDGYDVRNQASPAVNRQSPTDDSTPPNEQRETSRENATANTPAPSTTAKSTTRCTFQKASPWGLDSEGTKKLAAIQEKLKRCQVTLAKISVKAHVAVKRVGDCLIAISEILPHGKFNVWLGENFDGSRTTAYLYMRIAGGWSELKPELIKNPKMPLKEADGFLRQLKKGEKQPSPYALLKFQTKWHEARHRRRSLAIWNGLENFTKKQHERATRRQKFAKNLHQRLKGQLGRHPHPTNVNCHFLDSGAFSIWEELKKDGKDPLAYYDSQIFWEYVDSYANFVKQYGEAIDYFATVDAIEHPEITFKVQTYLEKQHQLRPVPIVHYGSDPSYLERYIKLGHTYIGLGGKIEPGKDCEAWLKECFAIVPDNVRIHGFGIFAVSLLLNYKWWSTDAATATHTARNGIVPFPRIKDDGSLDFTRNPVQIKVTEVGWKPSTENQTLWLDLVSDEFCQDYKYDYIEKYEEDDDMAKLVTKHYCYRLRANLHYFKCLERELRRSGKDIRLFYSGQPDPLASPEWIFGEEANIMLTFKDMRNGRPDTRFRGIYQARLKSKVISLQSKVKKQKKKLKKHRLQ